MDQNQINGYEMNEESFHERFKFIYNIQDPFVRDYEVVEDNKNKSRAIYKRYVSQTPESQQNILDNLQNYHKLSQIEGISKFLAYTKNTNEIIAAFQYNDMTVSEYSKTDQFTKRKVQFYVLLLTELTQIVKKMNQIGIDVDELNYSNILVFQQHINNHSRKRIKLMYDQRQKQYDKIVQGIKVFSSRQKLEAVVNNIEQFNSQNGQEAIYQIGLILIDLIFQCQIKNLVQNQNQAFIRDQPIMRSGLCNNIEQSYYTFIDGSVQRKQELISQKVKFLLNNKSHTIKQIIKLCVKMIGPLNSRLSLEELEGQSDRIQKIYNDSQKKIVRIVSNPQIDKSRQITKNQVLSSCENIKSIHNVSEQKIFVKESKQNQFDIEEKNIQFSKKEAQQFQKKQIVPMVTTQNNEQYLQKITRQTYNNSNKETSSTNIPSSGLSNPFISQNIKLIIPRQSILNNIKTHSSVKNNLENLIQKLQKLETTQKKTYFDNSTYYGQISKQTNKRDGEGVYVYTNGQISGDIYFGNWKDNILTSGTYIFKNGQAYEGFVKNGKQGWGKYRYNNGNVYQGEWKDDIKNGNGTMNYPNGDRYQGVWKNGKKNGLGKYFYNNGTQYEGNFANGKKNGFGTIFFTNGTRIQANWQQTHIQGKGKVYYPNEDYFQGNYHMSQKHGKGLYVWKSQNCKYDGDFKKDFLEGEAKLYFSDKQFYFGKIKNGKRDGQGTYNYQNGDKFSGEWKNDCKLIGCYQFENGDQFQGRFKENQLNFGVMRYSNGQIYEGQFRDGYRTGVGSYRSNTGAILYEGHWKNDNFIQQ